MDRLLQVVFGAFIRRGTFKLTTSRGRTFVFGDGTGVPVACAPHVAPRRDRPAARSRTQIRRSLYGRYLGGRAGYDCRRVGGPAGARRRSPEMGAAAMAAALHRPPPQAVQSAQARAPQRRASLRPRRPALFALPGCRPAIQLRLFRNAGALARRRAARQETASSPQS